MGSRCLPAPADPLPEPALHYFSAGGAPILRKPASVALSLAGTSALFSTISVRICHCRGCVSFSRGFASLPSLLVLASTCGTETWGKDLISLGKRRQILRVHVRGCTSLFVSVDHQVQSPCCDFQTSQGSQSELNKTRRFLERVTQTTELRKCTCHCLGRPPQLFHGFAGVQTCRSPFEATVVPIVRFTLQHAFVERLSPCAFPLAVQRAGIVFSLIRDVSNAFVLRTFNLAPWSGTATSECDEGFS